MDLNSTLPPGFVPTAAFGFLSNEGRERHLLEAQSSTGFVAWKLADGTTLVSNAMQVSLAPSPFLVFWSCAGYKDTAPAGQITAFDCHGNSLTTLHVRSLTGLRFLDCSYNKLTELPLDGLTALEALYADDNQFATLEVRHLRSLRMLSCARNRLTALDLSDLNWLKALDCEGNPIKTLNLDGCTMLQVARPAAK